MQTIKITLKTLMVVVITLFATLTWLGYKENGVQRVQAVEEKKPKLPNFTQDSNQTFLDDVRKCTQYIYYNDNQIIPVNEELLLAQAALESGWGTSRFAREGNNLFGIRTYDLKEPHMLPSNKPKNWGVKVYMHECDSVEHYIDILNNGTAFKKYREVRDSGVTDPIILLNTLDAYATDKLYFPKVRNIIFKIRKDYD